MLVASAYLPEFKVEFLETRAQRELATELLIEEASAIKEGDGQQQGAGDARKNSDRKSFFSKWTKQKDVAKMEVKHFMAGKTEDLQMILAYKRIKQVFRKTNVILPTSAASERLFLRGRQDQRTNRMKMGDETFKPQLLLYANKAM